MRAHRGHAAPRRQAQARRRGLAPPQCPPAPVHRKCTLRDVCCWRMQACEPANRWDAPTDSVAQRVGRTQPYPRCGWHCCPPMLVGASSTCVATGRHQVEGRAGGHTSVVSCALLGAGVSTVTRRPSLVQDCRRATKSRLQCSCTLVTMHRWAPCGLAASPMLPRMPPTPRCACEADATCRACLGPLILFWRREARLRKARESRACSSPLRTQLIRARARSLGQLRSDSTG